MSFPFSLHRGPKYVPPWELKPLPGESQEELQHRQNEQYFREQLDDNVQWWSRFDFPCDFRGAKVLDLGCGHGALSIAIAEAGAAEVLGIEIDANRIDFAKETLHNRYPALQNRVNFALEDVRNLTSFGHYDFVISKDSFEHIQDLDTVIAALSLLLKPGGKIVTGFSPLYYSPFGDHGRLCLPRGLWLHALLPEGLLLRWASFRLKKKVNSIADLGLTKITPKQFRGLFPESKWNTLSLRYNRGGRRLLPQMSKLRHIPWLEQYFTVSIYAVFKMEPAQTSVQKTT